jgi:hypothetical protein
VDDQRPSLVCQRYRATRDSYSISPFAKILVEAAGHFIHTLDTPPIKKPSHHPHTIFFAGQRS